MNRLFSAYNETHAAEIRSHDFRRRAVTSAFDAGKDPYTVAQMFGLNPQTAMKYYDAWKGRNMGPHFAELGEKLLPE